MCDEAMGGSSGGEVSEGSSNEGLVSHFCVNYMQGQGRTIEEFEGGERHGQKFVLKHLWCLCE